MTIQTKLLCAIAASAVAALVASAPAQALTAQECGAKYQACLLYTSPSPRDS